MSSVTDNPNGMAFMKTAFIQFLLIVVLGTGFAVLAGRSLAPETPPPAAASETVPAPRA